MGVARPALRSQGRIWNAELEEFDLSGGNGRDDRGG